MKSFRNIVKESIDLDPQLRKLGLKRTNKFNGIGKEIGGNVYCHRQYEDQFPADELAAAKSVLPADFEYNIVKYDLKTHTFSFIFSHDFDTVEEPSVDGGITVKADGTSKRFGNAGWIYHHKWLWVDDAYRGFDVESSKLRSLKWASLSGIDRARIGQRAFWDANVTPLIDKVQEQTNMKPFSKMLNEIISDVDDDLENDDTVAWDIPQQKFTSASTSISYTDAEKTSPKIFTAFRKGEITLGPINADIGGGKYDQISDMLADRGVLNIVWDKFNRDHEHNYDAQLKLQGGQADTATISNVLNVIAERKARIAVLRTAFDAVKSGGVVFISVYAAPKEGEVKNRDAYQTAMNVKLYMPEVELVFGKGNVVRRGAIIKAFKD